MARRPFRIETKDGYKYFRFNNEKFNKLVDDYAKSKGIKKNKVHIELVDKFGTSMDFIKTIQKWSEGKSGPSDERYFNDIAKFFNVSLWDFLDEIKDNKEEKMVVKVENNIQNTNIEKFNYVQIHEFIRIKNFILDYLYTFYASIMADADELMGLDSFELGFIAPVAASRILKKESPFDMKKAFSSSEMGEIKIAYENQEKFESLKRGLGIDFKMRKYGATSEKYENISIEDQEFVRENEKRMDLLYEYEYLRKNGYKILLRQEVDKTLSALPYEVYQKLCQIIELIPSPYWQEDYFPDVMPNGYDVSQAIPIEKYEGYEYDPDTNLLNSSVMSIHKTLFDIAKKYIE